MHPIEKEILLDEESPVFKAEAKGNGVEVHTANDLEFYIVRCGKALSQLSGSMDKARLSLELLNTKYLDSISTEDRSRSALIEMMVENGIIRVQSIYDRALILTNNILDLGIDNQYIHHPLIVTNENVVRYGLDKPLKAFSKACSEFKTIRNRVIHHDRFTAEQFDQLSLIISADHLAKTVGRKGVVNEDVLRAVIKNYLSSKQEELTSYLDGIETRLHELYDVMLPVYIHYKKKFRRK
ncbi:Cthe_2314 family HEPN domain-containing protein [Pseudomonas sp. OV546]|uniref:Cthe_2314 family HEPN domain-containing protein n=1 Tax=Pseudomonas sp. OV546 TaxID=1881063 RepID=UPI0008ECC94E|nr:Cthe_2314 family HEPN domain-containing protein [Pseudomonas sp. OV546]SFU40218.1 hypothetical protein SAMN05428951_101408 [Pseudomonas sp. OV546]